MKIKDLLIKIPVFQGGMGVGVSLSKLAGAVAKAGGLGVISTAQIGFRKPEFLTNPIETNLIALKEEIKKARDIAEGGVLGVNIMVATRRYEDYVKASVEAGIDVIISGAGMPMDLPQLVEGSDVKIIPIVSSKKALDILVRYWQKKYQRYPDAVIIEGPMAGGHLGFSKEEIGTLTKEKYDEEIVSIIDYVKSLENVMSKIPVIVAGGIFEREDMEHYKALGADGVQLATRFVTTEECDADERFKQAYIDATKEDIVIIKSPVGLPGRAIHNAFIDRVRSGERFMRGCRQCVKTCNVANAPFCITEALINAVKGKIEEGLIFCGSNAYRCKKIETVREIMEEFA
ncbi:MAG: nitronate monooxygenase family protein [Lachnospiraceae bacterium]|nr:nitronate monooxygenase family protein [Lachnospiraceae bacterium]